MKAVLVLFAFLTAWVEKDFKTALENTSKTWAEKNKSDSLKTLLSAMIPEGFEIGAIQNTSPTTATVMVELKKEGNITEISVDLVRESWPGKEDPYGDWGVIPESLKLSAGKTKKDTSADQESETRLNDLRVKADSLGIKYFKKSTAEEIESLINDSIKEKSEELSSLIAKAEDLGIDVPEGATAEELTKLLTEADNGGNQ
jgi:hypothetical protein